MKQVNIHDAKTNLSSYLAKLLPDEVLIICNRNVPVAELRALPKTPKGARILGKASKKLKISKTFFDPLPKDIEEQFY